MAASGSGRLKAVREIAQFIDEGMKNLERALSEVHILMPKEDHHEQAYNVMKGIFEEVATMEDHASDIKSKLQSMVAAAKLENEVANEKNKEIESGLLEIEDTLKKYGFDSSSMTRYDPKIEEEDESISTQIEMENLSLEEEHFEESNPMYPSPPDMQHLNDSLAGAEITPFLTSKLQPRSTLPTVSPSVTPRMMSHKSFSGNLSGSVQGFNSPISTLTVIKENYKKSLSPKAPPKPLVKPKFPVYSKITYELLGQEPPPEFYDN